MLATPILEWSAEWGTYCACMHAAKRRNDDQLVGKENHIGQRISTCEHTEWEMKQYIIVIHGANLIQTYLECVFVTAAWCSQACFQNYCVCHLQEEYRMMWQLLKLVSGWELWRVWRHLMMLSCAYDFSHACTRLCPVQGKNDWAGLARNWWFVTQQQHTLFFCFDFVGCMIQNGPGSHQIW